MQRALLMCHMAVATVLAWPALLSAQGDFDTAWVARYNSSGSGTDQLFGEYVFRVDGSGNVYALVSSNGIGSGTWDAVLIKYSSVGVKLWDRVYAGGGQELGQRLELDAAGFPHVCISSQVGDYEHIVTGKYTPDGDTVWIRSYSPPDSSNSPKGLEIDQAGNVIVIANLVDQSVYKGRVLKYDPGGNLLWSSSWPDTIEGIPSGYLASAGDIDDAGRIYVATYGVPGTTGLLKFSADGDLLWQHAQACGTTQSFGEMVVVADRIHLAGGSNCEGLYSPLVATYTTDGDSLWMDRELYEGQTTMEEARDIAVGPGGETYVAGNHQVAPDNVIGVIKYDADGNVSWKKTYGLTGYMTVHDMMVDTSGNLYISGTARVQGWNFRLYMLLKCDSAGDSLLLLLHPGSVDCDANHMVAHHVDIAGNIYVGGYSTCYATAGNHDVFAFKYSRRCDCFGDPVCDGAVADVVDVVSVVEAAFRGVPSMPDADCYRNRMDLDCSGGIDIIDVVKIVEVAFRGVTPESAFCDPTSF